MAANARRSAQCQVSDTYQTSVNVYYSDEAQPQAHSQHTQSKQTVS